MLSKVVYFGTDRNEELVTYSRFGCVLHGLGEFANNRLKISTYPYVLRRLTLSFKVLKFPNKRYFLNLQSRLATT